MKVSEVMTKDPVVIKAGASVLDAARKLAESHAGVLPVERDGGLLGMITERDLVVRVVVAGRDPARTAVEDAVSQQPKYCFEDEDVSFIAADMDQLRIDCLAVMDHDKHLVGIVSIEDLPPRQH